ncbi:hypothetical protein GWG65_26265 [Bradyrhizobium sp. CSA207]|uniref:hypothetical protein n=1 Tax=Bradyrhizobium sp. CSA207 TaxID=2698826 RepID=UPI0023AFD333|nr:hypothetical protein [Bradyrhizobium sp. CSA207]MDE5444889.1 hypothetical protein [Bradyrhizobium sp. CSA207]
MSSNIIELSARRAGRALPPENVSPVDFLVTGRQPAERYEPRETGRQRAGRQRNPLRHPCNRGSLAVTVAGRLERNEPLGYPVGAVGELRKGALAARQLADQLERLAQQHSTALPR